MRATLAVATTILAAGLASACGGQGGHVEPTTVTVTAEQSAKPGGTWQNLQDQHGEFLSGAASSACGQDYECFQNEYAKVKLLRADVMNMPESEQRTEVLKFTDMYISDYDKNCAIGSSGLCHPEMLRMDIGAVKGAIGAAAKGGE